MALCRMQYVYPFVMILNCLLQPGPSSGLACLLPTFTEFFQYLKRA